MGPAHKQQPAEVFPVIQQPEHDFLIPEVFAEYTKRVPEYVSAFTDDQLIGRANDVRFRTDLTTYEDGYFKPGGDAVAGIFEPHIRRLVRTDGMLQRRKEIFESLVADNIDPRDAEKQATQAVNMLAIVDVEKAHDPIVQLEIRKELLSRWLSAATSHAPASFERVLDQVPYYHTPDVAHPWEITKKLFEQYQRSLGGRIPPQVGKRQFAILAALDTAQPDTRQIVTVIGGEKLSTTLNEAKMRLVYAWHVQEVQAGLRLGRKLDTGRIRSKFEPLYNQLGYDYQDAQEYVLPSRAREVAITTSVALKVGSQVLGRSAEAAARVTSQRVVETVDLEKVRNFGGASLLTVGLLAGHASGAQAEKAPTTMSREIVATDQPAVDLNAETVAFSALPSIFEAKNSVRSGEKCADPFVYNDNMKLAVAHLKARGGKWKDEAIVLDFFLEKCMGLRASSGIVGNAEEESGSNPSRHQDGGPAEGEFMWEAGRLEKLLRQPNPYTHKTQLNYAWKEMLNGDMIDDLRKAKSPEDGAVIFERLFERAGIKHLDVRKGHARDVYEAFLDEYQQVEKHAYHAVVGKASPTSKTAAPHKAAEATTDFAKLFAENLAGQESSDITPTNLYDSKENDTATAEYGKTLTSALEKAIASTAPASPEIEAVPAVTHEVTPTHADNTPHHEAKPALDVQALVARVIANQQASALPPALETDPTAPAQPSAALPDASSSLLPSPAPSPAALGNADPTQAPATPDSTGSSAPTTPSVPVAPQPSAAPSTTATPPVHIESILARATETPPQSTAAPSSTSLITPPASAETPDRPVDGSTVSLLPLSASATTETAPAPATLIAAPASTDTATTPETGQNLVAATPDQAATNSGNDAAKSAITLPSITPKPPEKKAEAPKPNQEKHETVTSSKKHETVNGDKVPEVWKGNIYYSQYDKRWASAKYSAEGDGGTIAASGCGATSLAIVVANLADKSVTPVDIANYNMRHGYKAPHNGTSWAALTAVPKAFGLKAHRIHESVAEIKKVTDAGGYVIINGTDNDPKTPATTGGHIYVIRDVTPEGRLLVLDPAHFDKTMESWDPKTQIFDASTIAVAVTK
jgi:hypothetical protein